MASEIEYRHLALKVDMAKALQTQQALAGFEADEHTFYMHQRTHHLVFVEHGSNRDFDADGRKSRNWSLQFHGHYALRQVIRCSEYAESGVTWMKGRSIKAENYIKFYRELIEKAQPFENGGTVPRMEFELDDMYASEVEGHEFRHRRVEQHPFTAYLREHGRLELRERNRFGGKTESKLVLTTGGDPDFTMAAMAWLLDVAGDWWDSKRMFHLSYGQSISNLGSWLERRLPGEQGNLFVAAA